MENQSTVSIDEIKLDPEAQIQQVCKIIDHAKHTKFKHIDFNLLYDDKLQKNNHYSYLLGILQRFNPQKTQNIIEIKAMVQLSQMLQTCKLLTPIVLDSYLKKIIDWFSKMQSSGINEKLFEMNTHRSKTSTTKIQNSEIKASDPIRPQTGINRTQESKQKFNRPFSAAYGVNHKYRPYSSANTAVSTNVTKNMSMNSRVRKEDAQVQHYDRCSESDNQSRDDKSEYSEIQTKIKAFANDAKQLQGQHLNNRKQGDFQHTNQGKLLLHQVTGNQKYSKENRYLRNKMQTKEMQNILSKYKKSISRNSSQSNRRVESAKVFKNIKPSYSTIKQKQDQSSDALLTQFLFPIQEPKTVVKPKFVAKRPVSAMIKTWNNDVKHINYVIPQVENCSKSGFSLTKAVGTLPEKKSFDHLSANHILAQNCESFGDIQKIKKLLVKKGNISSQCLMKALIYDQYEQKENIELPKPQLMNNPFLKKKKKKVIKKKKVFI